MQNLKFSRLAENDLYDLMDYIAQDNPDAATNVYNAIIEKCQELLEHPQSSVVISSSITGLRRAVIQEYPNFLIFYRQHKSGIEIVRLGEGHRDWLSIIG